MSIATSLFSISIFVKLYASIIDKLLSYFFSLFDLYISINFNFFNKYLSIFEGKSGSFIIEILIINYYFSSFSKFIIFSMFFKKIL